MKLILSAFVIVLLPSCANFSDLKLPAGTVGCNQYSGLYGKASAIALNQDDVRKGATAKGKTTISCGDAQMTIETDVGVPAK